MNYRASATVIGLALIILLLCGCGAASTPTPTPTTAPPTDTPLPPIPTYEPKPTPEPFTSPVTTGVWSGSGSLKLSSGDTGELQVTFLVSDDGKSISRWQLGFAHCSQMIGGSDDAPIKEGVFSIEIDDPCESGETAIITGVFASATELVGSAVIGSFGGDWTAKPE